MREWLRLVDIYVIDIAICMTYIIALIEQESTYNTVKYR